MSSVFFHHLITLEINQKFQVGCQFVQTKQSSGLSMAGISKTSSLIFLCCFALTLVSCSSEPISFNNQTDTSASATSNSTFGLYDISSFDVYTDNNVVHLLLSGRVSAQDKQLKLHYSRSEDGGLTWEKTIPLDTFPATIASRGNDVQLAAKDNHLLAIWQTLGELPGMGSMVSAYSDDKGLTWKLGENPAANANSDQSHLDIIADRRGDFHVVWLEDPEENGYQSLRYAMTKNNGINWSKAQTLDYSTCSCCWNTLALSPDNRLNILYRDMKPRDMALLQSTDDGITWSRTSSVGEFGWQFDGCPHVGGSLTYAGADYPGQVFSLVWTGLDQKAGLYFLASSDDGKSWTAPQKIGNAAIHGDISTHNGKLLTIWDEMEPEGSSLFYATSEINAKTASNPKRLTQAVNAATHPRLAVTEHGKLAIWTEKPSKQPSRLVWLKLD